MSNTAKYQALETDRDPPAKGGRFSLAREDSAASYNLGPMGSRRAGKYTLSIPGITLIVFIVVVIFVVIAFASFKYSHNSGCKGAPYIYVSHSKEHNIIKISRDGCILADKMLYGVPRTHTDYRSMSIQEVDGQSNLFIANAENSQSSIVRYGPCSYWHGMRSYISSELLTHEKPFYEGPAHPYGLAFDRAGNLYASFQHTNVVLRGKLVTDAAEEETYEPYDANDLEIGNGILGSGLGGSESASSSSSSSSSNNIDFDIASINSNSHSKSREGDNLRRGVTKESRAAPSISVSVQRTRNLKALEKRFPGTFFQFGNASTHVKSDQGVRSIAVSDSQTYGELLWINNEFLDEVVVVNRMAEVVKVLEVKAPIGLHYDGYDVIREREGDLQVEKGGVGNEGKQAQEGEGEGEKQEQTNTNTNKLKHDEHKSKIKSEIKQKRRMYIGSRSKKEGEVIAVNVDTFEVENRYGLVGLTHPTGLTVYNDVLYVADQKLKAILTFDIRSERFLEKIWERQAGGDLEQLVLSHC